jgi:hypothetical protein
MKKSRKLSRKSNGGNNMKTAKIIVVGLVSLGFLLA